MVERDALKIGQIVGYVDRRPALATDPQWHVVHCLNASDDEAINLLERERYEVFYPRMVETRDVPKRKLAPSQRNSPIKVQERVRVPLFPKYYFVRFDLRDGRWRDVFARAWVQGMLCMGGVPAPIADVVIAAWRSVACEDGAMPARTTVREFAYALGEQVRIVGGPFFGFSGDIMEIPDTPVEKLDLGTRLTLLVSLFGRDTPIELTLAHIEKL